jgi:hypothetical protein
MILFLAFLEKMPKQINKNLLFLFTISPKTADSLFGLPERTQEFC